MLNNANWVIMYDIWYITIHSTIELLRRKNYIDKMIFLTNINITEV